jgi:RNA polymerase sigma-70 factor (ECF subfamily)
MRPDELPRIAHDPAAFEAFYREHVEAILRFVTRRVDDPHLAADLCSDVFLAAIDSADGYRPSAGAPGPWLFGIARNVVSSQWRRSARERRANARVEGSRLLEEDDVARIQERIDAQAQARDLHAAIGSLPDGERAVLELVALDGLTTPEAAAALGIRNVTARVRLHRARNALRTQLFDDESATTARLMEA